MAPGSHSGWYGLRRDRRYCAHCGGKLTLKMSIFISDYRQLAWHADCRRPWRHAQEADEHAGA
jgi:hypothetical protein